MTTQSTICPVCHGTRTPTAESRIPFSTAFTVTTTASASVPLLSTYTTAGTIHIASPAAAGTASVVSPIGGLMYTGAVRAGVPLAPHASYALTVHTCTCIPPTEQESA